VNVELRYVIILRASRQGSYEYCVKADGFVTTITDYFASPSDNADRISDRYRLFIPNDMTTVIADFSLDLCRRMLCELTS
jgi:hypothetical protein